MKASVNSMSLRPIDYGSLNAEEKKKKARSSNLQIEEANITGVMRGLCYLQKDAQSCTTMRSFSPEPIASKSASGSASLLILSFFSLARCNKQMKQNGTEISFIVLVEYSFFKFCITSENLCSPFKLSSLSSGSAEAGAVTSGVGVDGSGRVYKAYSHKSNWLVYHNGEKNDRNLLVEWSMFSRGYLWVAEHQPA